MALPSRLITTLSAEINLATQLLSLLEEEPRVLASNDPQAILTLSHTKQSLAEQLAEGENERRYCLEGSGLPMNLTDLESALKELGAEEAATVCRNLKQIAANCAEYNRSNGVAVENRLRYILRALEIVTGRTTESERELSGFTYGSLRNRSNQRGLGRSWAKV